MKLPQPSLSFHFLRPCALANRNKLREMIAAIFKQYKTKANSLGIVFCSDDYLLEINRTHLKHDYYTDIITFDLAEPNNPVEGEIYISVDRVKENAQAHQVSFNHELHRVIFHGVLHLCGFTDNNPAEKQSMTDHENKLLNKYFVSRGT